MKKVQSFYGATYTNITLNKRSQNTDLLVAVTFDVPNSKQYIQNQVVISNEMIISMGDVNGWQIKFPLMTANDNSYDWCLIKFIDPNTIQIGNIGGHGNVRVEIWEM